MASIIDYLTQGSRIFFTSWKNRVMPKQYQGNPEEICKQIVQDCWNGRFFQTSTTNFPQFWTRDFGWTTQALLKLKYQKEVQRTLRYALNRFVAYGKITTSITPTGKPFDFPTEAVDTLPWLIHSIKLSKFSYHSFIPFLNKEIKKYFEKFIDQMGLVKPDLHVSSIKDFAIRKSSCYDNSMVALLAKDLKKMKLNNPFKEFDYPALLKRHFWNGEYFHDDLQLKHYVAGDANLFPFLFGLGSEAMLKKSLHNVHAAGLEYPLPLKYTSSRRDVDFIFDEIFLRNYESDACWMHMGPLYVKLVGQVNKKKAKELKERITESIITHKNFLEVFNSRGKPYGSPFYYCDRGMIWAANYLML